MDVDLVLGALSFGSLLCEVRLERVFVLAEVDDVGLDEVFFLAEVDEVTDLVAAAFLVFCRFPADLRF